MKARSISVSCFLLLFLGAFCATAQEILVKGVVIDKSTKYRIALAEITNLRTGIAVGSNDMGFFQLKGNIGDTLFIEKRNYTAVKVAVTGTKDIVVNLFPSITSIDEVVISGQSKKAALDEMKRDFKKKGVFYGGKPPVLAYLFHPLSAIYELFGREPRNARRFGRYYNTEMQQSKIDQFFNPEIVNAYTGLEGKPLNQFMLDYRPDYKLTEKWNTYDGIKYIRESYKKYADTAKRP